MLKPADSSCCSPILSCYTLYPLNSTGNFHFLFSSSSLLLIFLLLLPSSFLCPYLRTLLPSLTACHPFPVPSGEWVDISIHCMCLLAWSWIDFINISQPVLWTTSLALWLSPQRNQGCQHTCCCYMNVVCCPPSWSKSASVVLLKVLSAPYSEAGLRKIASCGPLGSDPFLPSLLSGVLSGQGISPHWLTPEMGC